MSFNNFNVSPTSLLYGAGPQSVSGNSIPPGAENLTTAVQTTSAAGVYSSRDDQEIWKIFLLIGIGCLSCLAMVYFSIKIYLCTRDSKKENAAAEDPLRMLIGVNYLYNRALAGVAYAPAAQLKEPNTDIAKKKTTTSETNGIGEQDEKNRNQSANTEPTSNRRMKSGKRVRRSRRGRELPLRQHDQADKIDVAFKGTVVRVPLVKVNESNRRPLPKLPPANMALAHKTISL